MATDKPSLSDKNLEFTTPLLSKADESPAPNYTDAEKQYRSSWITRIMNAAVVRDATHVEFDDMDYLTAYVTNSKAGNAYIQPRTNPDDTRVVTGTTRDKGLTLLSALLNYNLETTFNAFDDEDLEIVGIGSVMEALVKKSREMELYDEKRPLIYNELLTQGTVFVEDVWVTRFRPDKTVTKLNWSAGVTISGAQWTTRMKQVFEGAEAQLLPGTKVYLGNIKEPLMSRQPYVATSEVLPYTLAKEIYGKWERWVNVPRRIVKSMPFTDDGINYRNWTLQNSIEDSCEIIKCYDPVANEFMLMINGVMMIPVGFPLTAISPSGAIPIAMTRAEDIDAFFAYGRSTPAKEKVPQQVLDEFLKLFVLKTQQSAKPPIANNTNRELPRNIYSPGSTHRNIDTEKVKPVIPTPGITEAEVQGYQMLRQIVDENTVSPGFSGDQTKDMTATQVVEMQKQQMQKLGSVIFGVVSLERQLAWLRLYNLLAHWTEPVDERINDLTGKLEKVYRTVTLNDTDLGNGRRGRLIVQMHPELANTMQPEQIAAEEQFLSRDKPTKKVYIHPEELKSQMLKMRWYATCTPTQKNTTDIQRVLFMQDCQNIVTLAGGNLAVLNMPYVLERAAILMREDPSKLLNKAFMQQGAMPQPGMPPPGAPGMPPPPQNSPMGMNARNKQAQSAGAGASRSLAQTAQAPQPVTAPTINTLVGGAQQQ